MAKKKEIEVTAEVTDEVTAEGTPGADLDEQQLVAKDLNEVLQLNPQINIQLSEEELEEAIKDNAGEVYYKHPEHGTDALQQTTFAYLLNKGYLTEPVVAEKPGAAAKTPKAVKEKAPKTPKAEKQAKEKNETTNKKTRADVFLEIIQGGPISKTDMVAKMMTMYGGSKNEAEFQCSNFLRLLLAMKLIEKTEDGAFFVLIKG